MLGYVFRRGYFGLIGVLLFTVPVFAFIRYMGLHRPRSATICIPTAISCQDRARAALEREPWYLVWSNGQTPGDYWPIALAFLAVVAALEAIVIIRGRHRNRLKADY